MSFHPSVCLSIRLSACLSADLPALCIPHHVCMCCTQHSMKVCLVSTGHGPAHYRVSCTLHLILSLCDACHHCRVACLQNSLRRSPGPQHLEIGATGMVNTLVSLSALMQCCSLVFRRSKGRHLDITWTGTECVVGVNFGLPAAVSEHMHVFLLSCVLLSRQTAPDSLFAAVAALLPQNATSYWYLHLACSAL